MTATPPNTYYAITDKDGRFDNLDVTGNLIVTGTVTPTGTITGSLALGTGDTVDLNGEADALVIDADGDTTISAPTDDQIDIEISGADDFTFTANTFTALSGSSIATNTIVETTAASGVTIDGALIKDGAIQAGQQDDVVAITGDGAITIVPSTVYLSKGSAAAITIAAPTVTTHDGIIIRVVAISAQAHVITSGTVGFNAKGASGTATFGGAIGDAITLEAYQGNWYTTCAPRNVTLA